MDNLTFDERRLLRLLEEMRPKLVNKAKLWGGKYVIPEDLAQDAIAKTWKNREGLSSIDGQVRNYVLTTLKRLITDLFRWRKLKATLSFEQAIALNRGAFGDYSDEPVEFESKMFLGLVDGWALSDDLRTMGMTDKENAIVMLRVAGMTFGETAEVLNLTEPAVKSAFLRFRRKAVRHLGAEYGITED